MIESRNPSKQMIDVALDLRQLNLTLRDRDDFFKIWNSLAQQLIGKQIHSGQQLELKESRGIWKALVLDSGDVEIIGDKTFVNVIDLERPPEIRHTCKEHLKNGEKIFGAFFCPICRDARTEARLCETHVSFLENKYAAYCREHLPHCQCRTDCADFSTFECDRCRKTFSENLKKKHPNDALTLLCTKCYDYQFKLCSNCQTEGRRRLGKSHCAYPTGIGDDRCGKRLCTFRHARQWQIWGPYWRGVVLCDEHFRNLRYAAPADLLRMLIVSKAPAPFLQVKVKDLYRLRNIVSYVRQSDFSWHEMERNLRELEQRLIQQSGVGKNVKDSLTELLSEIRKVKDNLPALEARLLIQVREFYRRTLLRVEPATAVLGVTIKRVFGREGNQTYRLAIQVGRDYSGRSMKGLLIGKGGLLVNQLKNELNLQGIDFEE